MKTKVSKKSRKRRMSAALRTLRDEITMEREALLLHQEVVNTRERLIVAMNEEYEAKLANAVLRDKLRRARRKSRPAPLALAS